MRAAIYTRLSNDRPGERSRADQEADCRALCNLKGFEVVSTFTDLESGYKRTAKRPGFHALLQAVRDGQVDAVVIWKLDRLTRQGIRQIAPLLDVLEEGNAILLSVHDPIDTSSAMGEGVLGLLASTAKSESEGISLRTTRAKEHYASNGLPNGGGVRAFGFEPDGMTVRPDEAAMLQEAAERVLGGESLSSICRSWGGKWQVTALRKMLMRPRIAGLREHRGEVVGEAAWPAILDRVTWERVCRLLSDPERRGVGGRTRLGSRLLSGMARCGRCGSRLILATVRDRGVYYRCKGGPGKPGCGGLSVKADDLEALVERSVLAALDSPAMIETLNRGSDEDANEAAAAVEAAEAALVEIAGAWGAGELSRAEWLAARSAAEARLEGARRRLHALRPPPAALVALGDHEGGVREAWPTLDLARRRSVVAALIDWVEVGPAVRGRNVFDPDRVEVIWRA